MKAAIITRRAWQNFSLNKERANSRQSRSDLIIVFLSLADFWSTFYMLVWAFIKKVVTNCKPIMKSHLVKRWECGIYLLPPQQFLPGKAHRNLSKSYLVWESSTVGVCQVDLLLSPLEALKCKQTFHDYFCINIGIILDYTTPWMVTENWQNLICITAWIRFYSHFAIVWCWKTAMVFIVFCLHSAYTFEAP